MSLLYTQYLYAGGTRVKKITRKSSGDKYITVYIDGIFEHSYHLDGSNAMDEELNELHVMDDQTRVAMLRTGYDDGTPATKYILSDHLGSSNVILETSGAVYNREEYYPFGETSFGAFGKKRYRYVGKEKDEESGLYYYGARYFQPWSCRFISVDPLAAKYTFYTPYQYAGNQPINFIDLDGKEQAPPQNNNPSPTPTPPVGNSNPPLPSPTPTAKEMEAIKKKDLAATQLTNLLWNKIAIDDVIGGEQWLIAKGFISNLLIPSPVDPNVFYLAIDTEKLLMVQLQTEVKEKAKDNVKDDLKEGVPETSKQLAELLVPKTFTKIQQITRQELTKGIGLNATNIIYKVAAKANIILDALEIFYKTLNPATPDVSKNAVIKRTISALDEMIYPNTPTVAKKVELPPKLDFVPNRQDNLQNEHYNSKVRFLR